MSFPLLQHPTRHVWDFWYWYDADSGIFRVYFLNAPKELVAKDEHHFHSVVGYAETNDFTAIDWIEDEAFTAQAGSWDNASIWTGCVRRPSEDSDFLLFYTSRDETGGNKMTQHIGLARSSDGRHWDRDSGIKLSADPSRYETKCLQPQDDTTHAWRDPFLFHQDGVPQMLVAAKSIQSPLGRKGCVALLSNPSGDYRNWETKAPIYAPSQFSECEVPQLYSSPDGQTRLYFSCQAKFDHSREPASSAPEGGRLYAWGLETKELTEVVPLSEGVYACQVIPELNDIVGFDFASGGLRRVGISPW